MKGGARRAAWGARLVAALLLGSAVSVRAASAYEEVIAPILRARCVECHGEQKQKAKLALHTWDALMRGSAGGPVVVARNPGESLLLQRLRLPLGEDEHMPPQDKPQPAPAELALLTRWIERGASATGSLDELQLPADLAAAARPLAAKLAAAAPSEQEPPWELDEAAVARARAPLARTAADLQRRFPGALTYESRTSPALQFTAVAFGREFGDRELAQLAPIAAQLVSLDLSGTAVTDVSAGAWPAFAALRSLRASFTALGDATVRALQPLPKLEALTLHATKVTRASADVFGRFAALRALRLGEPEGAPVAAEGATR